MPLRASLAALALVVAAGSAEAQVQTRSGQFSGVTVEYKVITPPGYDAGKAYPLVLVFTGGGQSIEAAENTLKADWQGEAARRGYILVSPAAPDGQLFFQEGDRAFPAFLD